MKTLKKFISYYRSHLRLFFLDMAAATVVAACGLFYPSIAREIIKNFSEGETTGALSTFAGRVLGLFGAPGEGLPLILFLSGMLLLVYLIKALCNYVVGYYGHVLGIRVQAQMRHDLFEKYESLSFTYFDDNKTGDLLSRLVNDLFDVSELAHHGPENLFLSILLLIGSFLILWNICPALTLIMFSVIPFIVIFTAISRRSMHRAMRECRRQIAVLNADAENSLSGIRESKAYVAKAHEMKKFNRENGLFAAYRGNAMHALGLFDSVMTLLADLLYLTVIAAGGIFLYRGKIDQADFAAFMLYIGMFLDPIKRFVSLFEQLQEGMTGFSRFCDVMALPNETDDGKIVLDDVKGEITLEDVTFRYGNSDYADDEKMVLSHLNLHIQPGKTLALVGSSGGGKSTICHLIPRFYTPQSGRILLDGVDVRDISLQSLRSEVGIVSQDVFLFDGTVRENIAYGNLDATEEEIIAAAKAANIHDYVMSLQNGYDTEVGERGVKLSGGQKQRVAIARVFLKNPKLLILDEATSALDNVTEMQIQSALEKLSHGRTVIVVAHRLSTVKKADEIVVINDGGIVEQGTHEELLAKNGVYRELYEYQFREA